MIEHAYYAPDAEVAVIGAVIYGAMAGEPIFEAVREKRLKAAHFAHKDNQAIFAAITKLAATGKPYDHVSLIELLRAQGKLETAGGSKRILELRDTSIATPASAAYHAGIVIEKAMKRVLMDLSKRATRAAEDAATTAVENVLDLERFLHAVRDAAIDTDVLSIDDALDVEASAEDLPAPPMFNTGLTSLDENLGPFFPKMVVLFGARPGKGKSGLGEFIATSNARRGVRVLFIPQEMGRRATLERMVARENFMTHRDFRTYSRAFRKSAWLTSALRGKPLLIADNTMPRTVEQIAAEISRFKPEIVVVDHLRWVKGWGAKQKGEARDEPATRVMQGLVELANKTGVVLVLMHQLNRDAEDKPPTLANFRDTGAIEELAHIVVGIDRKDGEDIAKFGILKNRSGDQGHVEMRWNGPLIMFQNTNDEIIQVRRPMNAPANAALPYREEEVRFD